MAEYHLKTHWTSGLAFDTEINSHNVRMDSGSADDPTKGPSPKRMVLAALMVCTGMDVISLLNKMRVEYTAFAIEGHAPITAEHPKTFERVDLKYIVTGTDIDREKVIKAITLSQEKYCGVSAMMRKHCQINWELEVKENENA